MVQMDYGNGKSFLILLAALYLTEVCGQSAIICTLSNELKA